MPPGGLGPAAVHQTACPLAVDDALRSFEEPLEAGRVDLGRWRAAGPRLSLSVSAVRAGRHRVVLG